MTAACEPFRLALSRDADGEASPAEARAARAHAASCPSCAGFAAAVAAAAAELRSRASAPGGPAGEALRGAILARIRRGDAVVLELRPFLRRVAAVAALVTVAATAAAFGLDGDRTPAPAPAADPGLDRSQVLAAIVRPRLGPWR
jgi:predicted anti-sigma-YlaC factor YlaD